MNQKIKLKLKQAAEKYFGYDPKGDGEMQKVIDVWFDGAQTILENPSEWGLVDAETNSSVVKRNFARTKEINQLQSQLTKYREALEHLERFTSDNPDYEFINHRLKEALKQ